MKKFLMTNSEQSLPTMLSRMTACDALSFHVFVTSKDLRRALVAMQHKQQIRSLVMSDLKKKTEQGDRFRFQSNLARL